MKNMRKLLIFGLVIVCLFSLLLIVSTNTNNENELVIMDESDIYSPPEPVKRQPLTQEEIDKKAIDSLSRYFETDFSGISETSDIIQPDNSVITVTTKEQIELYKKMSSAIISGKWIIQK